MVESCLVWARLSVQSPKHWEREAGKEVEGEDRRGGGKERKNTSSEERRATVSSSGQHSAYSLQSMSSRWSPNHSRFKHKL